MTTVIVGALIGFTSGCLGYGVDTWQFWAFAAPAACLYGFVRAV